MIDAIIPGAPVPDRLSGRLLEALPVAVYTTDSDGYILAYNRAATEFWGLEPQVGTARWSGAWRLYHVDGSPMEPGQCPMALALSEDRAIAGAEAVVERPDGTRVPFLAFPTPIHDDAGVLIGEVNTMVDISRQKAAQQAQYHLSAIVKSSHDAIVSKDLSGIIQTWNDSAMRVFGYSAEEAVGRSITMLIPPERLHEEVEILTRIHNGDVVDHFETVRVHKNGRRIPISLTISPIRTLDGKIVGVSKIARDITQQKENERRIKELMREVNHRVKNQFAVILSMIRETRGHSTSPEEFERRTRERIMALSRSHDLLVKEDWRGATVSDLLTDHLRGFGAETRVKLTGPLLTLRPMAVQYLGMAIHELATNAVKYGALSDGAGSIDVSWWVSEHNEFIFCWSERSSSTAKVASRSGFGTTVLGQIAPRAVSGKAVTTIGPQSLRWVLTAPLDRVEIADVA